MRAMVLPAFGAPLRLQTVPRPSIGPNDVLLRVRAAGVGLTVVIMTANPGRVTSFPRIPGHEVAGAVVEVGAEVTSVAVGARVVCHFYLTCGACRFCRSGHETLCTAFRGYVGQASDGGYAEYMAVPARNVTPIPSGVSDLDAAIASDAIATPYHACREEARVGPGDTVLIVGAGGGVGIHGVQVAKLCGGWVVGVDITDDKLDAAKAAGADAIVDGRAGDLAAQGARSPAAAASTRRSTSSPRGRRWRLRWPRWRAPAAWSSSAAGPRPSSAWRRPSAWTPARCSPTCSRSTARATSP